MYMLNLTWIITLALLLGHSLGVRNIAEPYTNEWIVHIEGVQETEARDIGLEYGFEYQKEIMPGYYLFRRHDVSAKSSRSTSTDNIDVMQTHPKVKFVEQQVKKMRYHRAVPNDPSWVNMWYLNGDVTPDMTVQATWDAGFTGSGVTVAVVDDGVQTDHPDLSSNLDSSLSYDFYDGDSDPNPSTSSNDHGTNVAGCVAAVQNNGACVTGIAHGAKFAAVRILGDSGVADYQEAQALSVGADISTNSWGPSDGSGFEKPGSTTMAAFADRVRKGRKCKGTIFVFAAGNGEIDDNCNADGYVTQIYTNAITSLGYDGQPETYTEICAAAIAATYGGVNSNKYIHTTSTDGTCVSDFSGTSASAPLAAAIIALALEANSDLTWRDVQHLIVRTAKKHFLGEGTSQGWQTNGAGFDVSQRLGFGLMDSHAMVQAADTWLLVPESTTCLLSTESVSSGTVAGSGTQSVFSTHTVDSNACSIRYLEHVRVLVVYSCSSRGDVEVYLTSPSGTKSWLLSPRVADISVVESATSWWFMTVHMWGENPTGDWQLEFKVAWAGETGVLHSWQLELYGTHTDPTFGGGSSERTCADEDSLSAGEIVGIIIGSIVAIAVIAGVIFVIYKCVTKPKPRVNPLPHRPGHRPGHRQPPNDYYNSYYM